MRVIAGNARGRRLKTRKGLETRPTADRIKEALFNVLAPCVAGSFFLDVFAGNGGIGIEALSRGAQSCTFVEKNSLCVKIIKDNLLLTGLAGRAVTLNMDVAVALNYLCKKEARFDLIFFDPPYFSHQLKKALKMVIPLILPGGLVVVEHRSRNFSWYDNCLWRKIREKAYGDTTLSFIVPMITTGNGCLPQGQGGEF